MGVTDCHVHINPLYEMRPEVRARMQAEGPAAEIDRYIRDPPAFLEYLDRCGVERAVLINYVSPEVVGYTEHANEFVVRYCAAAPDRLIAVGGIRPDHPEPAAEIGRWAERGMRGLKLHPPHQGFAPNDYRGSRPRLAEVYAACVERALPVIIHTGTSVFPRARSRYGEPLLCEDVAIDFPELTLVLAHGGRPLWMDQAMFLARRFPNVYLDLSSIPPARLLQYFPDLAKIGEKLLFGSDWPGPGVEDIGKNLEAFRACGLAPALVERILEGTPERVFPRRR